MPQRHEIDSRQGQYCLSFFPPLPPVTDWIKEKKNPIKEKKTKILLLPQTVFCCSGSPPSSTEGSNRRLVVYEHCIPLCESGNLQTEVVSDIIGLLMLEVIKKSPSLIIILRIDIQYWQENKVE